MYFFNLRLCFFPVSLPLFSSSFYFTFLVSCLVRLVCLVCHLQGTNPVAESRISLADFNILKVIGRGSYAKVLMVELKSTKRIYAMKVIKKDLVMDEEV